MSPVQTPNLIFEIAPLYVQILRKSWHHLTRKVYGNDAVRLHWNVELYNWTQKIIEHLCWAFTIVSRIFEKKMLHFLHFVMNNFVIFMPKTWTNFSRQEMLAHYLCCNTFRQFYSSTFHCNRTASFSCWCHNSYTQFLTHSNAEIRYDTVWNKQLCCSPWTVSSFLRLLLFLMTSLSSSSKNPRAKPPVWCETRDSKGVDPWCIVNWTCRSQWRTCHETERWAAAV